MAYAGWRVGKPAAHPESLSFRARGIKNGVSLDGLREEASWASLYVEPLKALLRAGYQEKKYTHITSKLLTHLLTFIRLLILKSLCMGD